MGSGFCFGNASQTPAAYLKEEETIESCENLCTNYIWCQAFHFGSNNTDCILYIGESFDYYNQWPESPVEASLYGTAFTQIIGAFGVGDGSCFQKTGNGYFFEYLKKCLPNLYFSLFFLLN